MPEPVIRVVGAQQLRRTMAAAGRELDDLKDANAAVARFVASVAAARAPKRTGRLAASIRPNRAKARARVSAGGAAVPWAGPIHWGWPSRNIPAQPFARDAATDTQAAWLPMYEKDIQQALNKVKGA